MTQFKLFRWTEEEQFNWKRRPVLVRGVTLRQHPEEMPDEEWREFVVFVAENHGKGKYVIREFSRGTIGDAYDFEI